MVCQQKNIYILIFALPRRWVQTLWTRNVKKHLGIGPDMIEKRNGCLDTHTFAANSPLEMIFFGCDVGDEAVFPDAPPSARNGFLARVDDLFGMFHLEMDDLMIFDGFPMIFHLWIVHYE